MEERRVYRAARASSPDAKIQSDYEVKKQALDNVRRAAHRMNINIDARATEQKNRLEAFEEEQVKSIRSEDLDNKVFRRNFRTLTRTMFGSTSARIAKMPYTLAARYQALKGDNLKRQELLNRAREIVKDIMTDVESKNTADMKETEKRINKFNEVDAKTTLYSIREKRVNAVNQITSQFLNKNEKGKVRRNISIGLAAIGNGRRYTGNILAQVIENVGNFTARKAAIMGFDKAADFVAEQTVATSDKIVRNVARNNKALFNELNRRTEGYDRAARTSTITAKNLELKQSRAKARADNWEKNHKNKGFITRMGMKTIKLANRAVMSSTKFVAKGDMRITELYAKTASVIGFDKHAKSIVRDARIRNEGRMDKAESFNTEVRKITSRVFGFKDKRKQNVNNIVSFLGEFGRDITGEFSEGFGELKDILGEVANEIETKRNQHQVKRKFKAGDRNVGHFEKGAQKVIDLISPSLDNSRPEKAAAQAEVHMNPERRRRPEAPREDYTGR